jgi:hypothetical protein
METCDRRRNLCCTGHLMLMGIIQNFNIKRVISTPVFGDTTREILEQFCIFLHFANSETVSKFPRCRETCQNFYVSSHVSNRSEKMYLPNQDISIDEITDDLGRLSFQTVPPSQGIIIWNYNL